MKSKPSLSAVTKNLHIPFAREDPLPSPAHSLRSSHSCSSSDAPLCWICMDDESTEVLLMNACGCRDRHVHGSCLASWVHRSQQHACKVCTQPWSPVFRPSEMLSVVELAPRQSSIPLHRQHDMACYSVSVMFSFGFVYGMLYTHYGNSVESQLLTSLFANACVVLGWNRVCASPLRRQNPNSAFEDLCMLSGTYTFFLAGWVTMYFVMLPDIQVFLYNSIIAHAWNFFTFCILLSFRCFCLQR